MSDTTTTPCPQQPGPRLADLGGHSESMPPEGRDDSADPLHQLLRDPRELAVQHRLHPALGLGEPAPVHPGPTEHRPVGQAGLALLVTAAAKVAEDHVDGTDGRPRPGFHLGPIQLRQSQGQDASLALDRRFLQEEVPALIGAGPEWMPGRAPARPPTLYARAARRLRMQCVHVLCAAHAHAGSARHACSTYAHHSCAMRGMHMLCGACLGAVGTACVC